MVQSYCTIVVRTIQSLQTVFQFFFYKIVHKMQQTNLLIIIVLSLAVPICQSVLSEEIDLNSEKSYTVKEDVINPIFLKCKCLLYGLIHMRLALLAFPDTLIHPDLLLGTIMWFNGREVISMLYNLPGVKIGSLWPIHLYTGLLRSHYVAELIKNDWRIKIRNLGRALFAIHSYVIEKLWSEWNATGCPYYELNDWYHQWHEQNPNAELHTIQEMIRKNNVEFQSFSNKIKSTMSMKEYLETEKLNESLKMKVLFLNEFSKDFEFSSVLMKSYDLSIGWAGTDNTLKKAWKHARRLSWNTDNLQVIKLYYTMHFDFFKTIFFRLTWKHLLYIEIIQDVSCKYFQYAQQWKELLDQFGKVLHIENDPHIRHLLKAFDDLANRKTSIVHMINDLNSILSSYAQLLNCNATRPIVLSQETVDHYLQAVLSTKDELVVISTMVSANTFIKHLKLLLRGVDFGVIRSLIEYIDELNLGSE